MIIFLDDRISTRMSVKLFLSKETKILPRLQIVQDLFTLSAPWKKDVFEVPQAMSHDHNCQNAKSHAISPQFSPHVKKMKYFLSV